MDRHLLTLIQQIHSSPLHAAFAVSGGGSQALAWLLGVPGASHTVLEVVLPYSPPAFEQFVGQRPAQFVSEQSAVMLAQRAYERSRMLVLDGADSVGVACTAALITDRPKRGDHRCDVAVCNRDGVRHYALTMAKGARDRAGEESVVSKLVILGLAKAVGLAGDVQLDLLPGETVESGWHDLPDYLLQVVRASRSAVIVDLNQSVTTRLPQGVVLLPGSFNPLHAGHLQLGHVAAKITGRPLYYELAIENVDKPPLPEAEARRRLRQFAGLGQVAVTRAPLFTGKAELFSNSVFVVGYDTAVRTVSPQYYDGSESEMLNALAYLRDQGTRFLVAGRLIDGKFRTLSDVKVPDAFAEMFIAVPAERFRVDVSSTQLRAWGVHT